MEILRAEYLEYMTFGAIEKPLFVELFGLLIGLEDEWRKQGASSGELDLTAFGFDHLRRHHVQVNTGFLGDWTRTLLAETDEYRIERDHLGRRVKLCKNTATIPLPLDYPVTDMASWLKLKPHYEYNEDRFSAGWDEAAKSDPDAFVVVSIPGGFDEPRQLMGEEELCVAYYEQPELIQDILQTIGDTAERVLDRVLKSVRVDQLSVHEDLAGKSGSLIGPNIIDEFIRPYYRRVWDMLAARGGRIFQQDSDGDVNSVIPAFLATGLTCLYPMEPAAGMDPVAIRAQYGQQVMMLGGIDKHVLRQDKAAIRAELEYKLQAKIQTGGMVFGLDHRIPNGTPLAHYRYYVKTAREILGLHPNPQPSWARMAF